MTENETEGREIKFTQNYRITYECGKCSRKYEDKNTIYKEIYYKDGEVSNLCPEPSWKCPKHNNESVQVLLDTEIEKYWT